MFTVIFGSVNMMKTRKSLLRERKRHTARWGHICKYVDVYWVRGVLSRGGTQPGVLTRGGYSAGGILSQGTVLSQRGTQPGGTQPGVLYQGGTQPM